jgi:hypothetical protein
VFDAILVPVSFTSFTTSSAEDFTSLTAVVQSSVACCQTFCPS